MHINDDLKSLYESWKNIGEPQGLIDEPTYKASKPRIVLLGKELNEKRRNFKNLFTFMETEIKKGQKGKSFSKQPKQVGLWAYGILKGFPDYSKLTDLNLNICAAEGLKSIGWTNVKKPGGKGKAVDAEIKRYAEKQFYLWIKELEIMDPQVILFAGTYNIASSLFLLGSRLETKFILPKCRYSVWQLHGHDCLCVDFYNPGYWGSYQKSYQHLAAIFNECKKQGLCNWMK